jgi:hypothetical protein
MSSSISGTVAEIFLQHFEQLIIKHLLDKHNLSFYTRYVDDIFIIFDSSTLTEHMLTQQIKQTHMNI